jgi:hypothetical protein
MHASNDRIHQLVRGISRRDFLGAAGVTGAALLTGQARSTTAPLSEDGNVRRRLVFATRCDAARAYLGERSESPVTNGDESRYDDKRASFAKTLPHDELGEVERGAFARFGSTLERGQSDDFDHLLRDQRAEVGLNDPQAAYALDLAGTDGYATALPPPPAFASRAMAAEMVELYWLALTRDVPFRHYGEHSLIRSAAADLNACGGLIGPGPNGGVTAQGIFRGETGGDHVGPHLSQFLWREIPYGIARIDQRYRVPVRGQNFLTDYQEWLACQRGQRPRRPLVADDVPRYICSHRELAEFVHQDFSFQAYLNAALIALTFGESAWSPANPYRGSKAQFGDITFGAKNVLTLIAQASLMGQKGAYYHKWLVHRRLRPEVMAGRVEVHATGRKPYDIHPALLQCDGVARVVALTGSRLLPSAFPEGCPTHPSYPAAHAVNAGACATILKAFFDEDFVMPEPVEATADGSRLEPWRGEALTLGNEINKLASNIALGRDAAGVHYRSDSIQGLAVGEQQAIGLLRDYSRTYRERFDGFVLTRFDGRRIRIRASA